MFIYKQYGRVPFRCNFTHICCFCFCLEIHSDLVRNEQLLFWHTKDAEQFSLYLVAILLLLHSKNYTLNSFVHYWFLLFWCLLFSVFYIIVYFLYNLLPYNFIAKNFWYLIYISVQELFNLMHACMPILDVIHSVWDSPVFAIFLYY